MPNSSSELPQRQRILIFSTAYLPFIGGAEIAVKEITDRLVRDFGVRAHSGAGAGGYDFEMITINLDGRQKWQEQIGPILVHRIGGRGYFYKLLFPFAAFWLAGRLHRKRHFTAVWSIMASFSGFAALFFKYRYTNVPFILSLQEGDPLSRPKRRAAIVWPLFGDIFRRADKIQAISSYLGGFAFAMGAVAPITIIPNGVDVKAFSAGVSSAERQKIRERFTVEGGVAGGNDSSAARSKILITVSRLVEKNGIADIIEALALLPESIKLIVVGTGPLEQFLKDQAAKLGLTGSRNRVFFAGLVSYAEIPRWLAAADIFIRPSLSEGMGNVFIEAMAAGLPVIATPVGGITDFLRDGETGVLCQPNDPQSVAAAVHRILDDPALAERLIKTGRELAASRYDWNMIASEMNMLFTTPMINRPVSPAA